MKKFVLLISVVALFVVSCEQSKNIDDGCVEKHRLTACTESSRTTLGDDNSVLWSAGDQIAVLGTKNDQSTYNVGGYLLVEGAGTTSAIFEGSLGAAYDTYSAFYPATMYKGASLSGMILFYMPPQGVVYTERNFVDRANPMYAVASADKGLAFKNLCGILELQIKGEGSLSAITIQTNKAISGYFLVLDGNTQLYGAQGYDQYGVIEASVSPAITLSANTPRSLYVILPPATYDMLSITTTDTAGKSTTVTTNSSIVVERSRITPVTPFTHTANGDDNGGGDGGDDDSSLEDPNENPDKEW